MSAATILDRPTLFVPAPVETERGRSGATLAAAVIVCVLVLSAIGVLAGLYSAGYRWFIVETPSMGQAAPVGSLIIDSPTAFSALRVGDVITFHPPTEPAETFTHRIVGITAPGVSTRGDINGALDPWTVSAGDILGTVTIILPGVGWLVRGLPILLLGGGAVWFATARLNPQHRQAIRITGFTLIASIAAAVLRPFVSIIVLATAISGKEATATVVSTGMLPINVGITGGSRQLLASGQVGHLSIPASASNGHYAISAQLQLPLLGWVVFWVICATPLLWCLIVGLPPRPKDG